MAVFTREIMWLVYHHLLTEGYDKSAKILKRECPQLKEFKPPYKLPSPLGPSLADLLENFFQTKSYIIDELNLLKSVLSEQESLLILTKRLLENFKYLTREILLTPGAETCVISDPDQLNPALVSLEENENSSNKKPTRTIEGEDDKFVPVCHDVLEERDDEREEMMVEEDIENNLSESSSSPSAVQQHVIEDVFKPFRTKIPHASLRALLDPLQLPAESFCATQETLNTVQKLICQETNTQTAFASAVTVPTPGFSETFKTLDSLPNTDRQHVEKPTVSPSKSNLSCKPRKIGETSNQIIVFQPSNQTPLFPAPLKVFPKEKNPQITFARCPLPEPIHHPRKTLKFPSTLKQEQIVKMLRINPQLKGAYTKQRSVLKQQMQPNQNQQAMPGQQGQQEAKNKYNMQQRVTTQTIRGACIQTIEQEQQNQPRKTKLSRIAPKVKRNLLTITNAGASGYLPGWDDSDDDHLVDQVLAFLSCRPAVESQAKRSRNLSKTDAGPSNENPSQPKRCRQ